MMKKVQHLKRQQQLEQHSAAAATCSKTRTKHDDLARAYGKIIGVLEREGFQAPAGAHQPWVTGPEAT